MLKRIIKTEEFFYDVQPTISHTRGLKRGIYKRLKLDDSFVWYDAKGHDVTDYYGEQLEKMYKEMIEKKKKERCSDGGKIFL